jgi:hypothetical protein
VLLYVLLAGLVSSRLGLWLFDLAVTQLQQEMVPGNQLGEDLGHSMRSAYRADPGAACWGVSLFSWCKSYSV